MLAPDYRVRQLVRENGRQVAAETYVKQMGLESMKCSWFEAKSKFDFAERAKREQQSVQEELALANIELATKRRYRLQQLYSFETREFERELASLGLAVRRRY